MQPKLTMMSFLVDEHGRSYGGPRVLGPNRRQNVTKRVREYIKLA